MQSTLLENKQKQLGVTVQKLVTHCETRWNSTYDMVKRIVDQQQAITAALTELNKSVI